MRTWRYLHFRAHLCYSYSCNILHQDAPFLKDKKLGDTELKFIHQAQSRGCPATETDANAGTEEASQERLRRGKPGTRGLFKEQSMPVVSKTQVMFFW